jgi:hypothetical protein
MKESLLEVFFQEMARHADAFLILSNDGEKRYRWPPQDGGIFSLESPIAA